MRVCDSFQAFVRNEFIEGRMHPPLKQNSFVVLLAKATTGIPSIIVDIKHLYNSRCEQTIPVLFGIRCNTPISFLSNLYNVARLGTDLANVFHALHWRHNDHDDVSNRQPYGRLLNRLFRHSSKKTSKLRVTGLCAGNSPVTGEFPAQRASNAEIGSIWWRHHAKRLNQGHKWVHFVRSSSHIQYLEAESTIVAI